MSLNKYHPAFDKGEAYFNAAQNETDPEKKLILERAAASVAYLHKHMVATQNLLARMNNVIVEAIEGEEFFDQEDMEQFLPDMRSAIEPADDLKNKFSTPVEEWSHLSTEQDDLCYLQDSRDYVGNNMLWWKVGGRGYTTDIRQAQVYDRDTAMRLHKTRDTDIPWRKTLIDSKSSPTVDHQYLRDCHAETRR